MHFFFLSVTWCFSKDTIAIGAGLENPLYCICKAISKSQNILAILTKYIPVVGTNALFFNLKFQASYHVLFLEAQFVLDRVCCFIVV